MSRVMWAYGIYGKNDLALEVRKFVKWRPCCEDDFVSLKYSAIANKCDVTKACVSEGGCNVLAQRPVFSSIQKIVI